MSWSWRHSHFPNGTWVPAMLSHGGPMPSTAWVVLYIYLLNVIFLYFVRSFFNLFWGGWGFERFMCWRERQYVFSYPASTDLNRRGHIKNWCADWRLFLLFRPGWSPGFLYGLTKSSESSSTCFYVWAFLILWNSSCVCPKIRLSMCRSEPYELPVVSNIHHDDVFFTTIHHPAIVGREEPICFSQHILTQEWCPLNTVFHPS